MTLSVVYPPKRSTTTSTIDIVAVHGLGGDAIDTWTHPKSNAFWLKDFLPQQIPDARILTFGYNAVAAFSESTAEVIDHAKSLLASLVDKREEQGRPLIFIAHSLGGIVVKQALLQARLEPRYEPIRNATLGIIFFGTPHRGSDKAVYGKVLANVAQTMTHRPPARLVSALQTNSDVLLRLTSDFRFQLPQYQVVSFYEQRPMKIFSSLIVEKQSALLEVEHEDQIPVDDNHSAMCKFATEEDDTFEKVYKRIQRIRKESQSQRSKQVGSLVLVSRVYNKHYEVPHLLSPAFTGHDEICQSLDSSLVPAHPPRVPVQQRFVIYGLGGSGKTQVCVRYAQVHRERYWGVFWIDASTTDSIRRGFTQIAPILQVDQDIESVKRALANLSQPWLLIFDNADDPKLSLTPYFPAGDRGDIIITSRNPQYRQYSTVGAKEVGQMAEEDAVALLAKAVYGTPVLQTEQCEGGRKVAQTLGCLALAIVQAGAYIRETSCTFDDYLELYHRQQEEVLTYFPQYTGTDYRYTIYTTWQVSLDRIESMQDATSRHALVLLKLLCFYHHDQIPMHMFYNAWHNSQRDQSTLNALLWPEGGSDFFDYRRAVQAAVTLLASFSLITREADVSLSMHPLVHDWCRDKVAADDKQARCRRAISLLTRSVAWKFETEDYTFRRSLVSHVHACLRVFQYGYEVPDEQVIWAWPVLALILGENGSIQDAIPLLERVVALKKSKLGEEDPDTLRSMHSLANRYGQAGRREEALRLAERVVALQKIKPGEEHPDTLRSIRSLATRYSEAGRREEALRLMEQVVALQKSKLGEEHPDTLTSMQSLALRYSETGRRAEALRLAEQVVALQKIKPGEGHPETLRSMHGLAIEYSEAGRREEALQLTEQVVAVRKSKLVEEHPDTLRSMHSLALRYSEAGRGAEALQLAQQVLGLRKSKLGQEHADTLASEILLTHLSKGVDETLSTSEVPSTASFREK